MMQHNNIPPVEETNTTDPKKKQQKKASNAPALAGILLVVAGIVLIPGLYDGYTMSGIEKDGAQASLQVSENRLQRLETDFSSFNSAPSTEKTSTLSKIPEKDALNQSTVLKELETIAGSTGASILNIGFREANEQVEGGFGAEEVAMSITGSTESSLLGFIDTLEKSPRLYHIQGFTINKSDSGVVGDLRVLLYYHN